MNGRSGPSVRLAKPRQSSGEANSPWRHEEASVQTVEDVIITNNPLVLERFPDACRVDGGPCDVFAECLSRLDRGFALKDHPLAGSIRLCCNPFRSIRIDGPKKGYIDSRGIEFLLDAIHRVTEALLERPSGKMPDEDYALIDLDLLVKGDDGRDSEV